MRLLQEGLIRQASLRTSATSARLRGVGHLLAKNTEYPTPQCPNAPSPVGLYSFSGSVRKRVDRILAATEFNTELTKFVAGHLINTSVAVLARITRSKLLPKGIAARLIVSSIKSHREFLRAVPQQSFEEFPNRCEFG